MPTLPLLNPSQRGDEPLCLRHLVQHAAASIRDNNAELLPVSAILTKVYSFLWPSSDNVNLEASTALVYLLRNNSHSTRVLLGNPQDQACIRVYAWMHMCRYGQLTYYVLYCHHKKSHPNSVTELWFRYHMISWGVYSFADWFQLCFCPVDQLIISCLPILYFLLLAFFVILCEVNQALLAWPFHPVAEMRLHNLRSQPCVVFVPQERVSNFTYRAC